MNIVHISPAYAPVLGGAEWHMKVLSEGLAARGHRVSVLTTNALNPMDLHLGVHGALPERECINGVSVIRFAPDGGALGAWMRRWEQLRSGWRSMHALFGPDGMALLRSNPQVWQIMVWLLRTRADVVMAMNWHWSPAYYAYLARRMKDFIFVGLPQFHTDESWSRRTIYRRMLAGSSAILANTAHEEQFVRAQGARRVEVAGVGVHPECFAAPDGGSFRGRYGIGSEPVVGFVGRQQVNKGIVHLVHAMKLVWRWNPDVRLVLAGHLETAHQELAVRNAIEQLTASERERLIEISRFEDAEKPSLYWAFDVFVLPSISDSFGIAYLEAWLCRKPVIGARSGSTACVIEDGVDGLLVEAGNADDLAAQIIALLSDRKTCKRMGAAGYAKTIAHHTWEKVIDRVEAVYRDLTVARKTSSTGDAGKVRAQEATDCRPDSEKATG